MFFVITTTKITLVPPDINAKKVDADIKGDNDIDQEVWIWSYDRETVRIKNQFLQH